MSNLEVAQYLLQHGLEGLDGVLFLNERNERVDLAGAGGHMGPLPLGITWDHWIWQVVLERDSMKIIELAECLGYLGAVLVNSGDMLFSKFSNYFPLAGVRTQFR